MGYDKIVDSAALDGALTGIADAIRGKTGNTDKLTLDGMAAAIDGIQVGGDDAILLSLVEGTITDFVATERMRKIGDNALRGVTTLRSADLTKLGAQNSSLTKLIGFNAFDECTSLTNIVLPEALEAAKRSTEWMYSRAFQGTALTEFDTQYQGTFGWSSVQVFKNCKSLRRVRIPNIQFSSFEYFDGCGALELVEFGGGQIGKCTFRSCASLHAVIIRSDAVTNLVNADAFSNVPGPVNIYVNESLIESYRVETNWASLYAVGTVDFVAIEGSEYG